MLGMVHGGIGCFSLAIWCLSWILGHYQDSSPLGDMGRRVELALRRVSQQQVISGF